MSITQKIKTYAIEEAGFDLVGVSSVVLDEKHGNAVESWVEKGYAASMGYMALEPRRRAEIKRHFPEARSVVVLGINYYHPEDKKPENILAGKVAKYAYGRDYHKIIQKRLKNLAGFIESLGSAEGIKTKCYVDTGPILEKAFAQNSGLGFFGKNTNIITREYGSWIFLSCVLTNLDLEEDKPHLGACGTCRICIDACPTGALLGDYQLDAGKCISYLTIENKSGIPAELKKGVGEWVFGCDICQDVCPYNFRAKTTKHHEIYPNKIAGSWVDIQQIQNMTDDESFRQIFSGSPVIRSKKNGMQRNCEVVLENMPA